MVVEALGDSLPTKNLGEVKFFLGCAFIRDHEAGTIEISQQSYIRSVLERFNICRTSPFPASLANDNRSLMEDEGGRRCAVPRGGGEPDVDRQPDKARHLECCSGGGEALSRA